MSQTICFYAVYGVNILVNQKTPANSEHKLCEVSA